MNPNRAKMLSDILITAVEGGTGYWASVSGYRHSDEKPEDTYVMFHVDEEDGSPERLFPFRIETLELGIRRIVDQDPPVKIREDLRRDIQMLDLSNGEDPYYDAVQWDADTADVIVQVALFGEIVYG